ncbi:TlyA family RNA methyltransferase [Candidatus Aquiluna sp. UB-MaderosW2red]|uniref:TlyA family RNA methyltransferase n=1 Tax=Candidatus Aquiluna sp. UB-MaderosW2red TaxID=1855377 RepID=UPI000875D1A7|nr:TlyA family RNA methyltransferase [Candidatus Aquiluna sp. UB-MaderosW2red]SCX13024.1 23S rRNA (cytidine1920-2'-O)/16S rRNA (cytidine1409-2'-O)-methyltransferase [Candidatus Aquiluna sp. UB-MaderosW2red]
MAERLDIELVVRLLARSRSQAAQLISQNRVEVNGKLATKSSAKIEETDLVNLTEGANYVSRAGQKLAEALIEFGVTPTGWCLDAGSSTGGFTQVLLEQGAHGVVAVDVGHDQLVAELKNDGRVISLEGCNLRDLTPGSLKELVGKNLDFSLVVADLSFISLTLVLSQLAELAPKAPMVLLVKPQFEVGKHSLSANGIVTDWREKARAMSQVADNAVQLGYEISGLTTSSLKGTHGNVEFLLWITPNRENNRQQWSKEIERLAKGK